VNYPDDSIEQGAVWHLDPQRTPFGRVMNVCDYNPVNSWAQAGEIIDRHDISVTEDHGAHDVGRWMASRHLPDDGGLVVAWAPAKLVAALRCFVVSELGVVVDVPDALLQV
jgi:hypothetical protein